MEQRYGINRVKATDVMTMQNYRAQGMTNAQIAREMGISVLTVRRHIGNQPSGVKAIYGSEVSRVTDIDQSVSVPHIPEKPLNQKKKNETSSGAILHLDQQISYFKGAELTYQIDIYGNLLVQNKNEALIMDFTKEQADTFFIEMLELMAIRDGQKGA